MLDSTDAPNPLESVESGPTCLQESGTGDSPDPDRMDRNQIIHSPTDVNNRKSRKPFIENPRL